MGKPWEDALNGAPSYGRTAEDILHESAHYRAGDMTDRLFVRWGYVFKVNKYGHNLLHLRTKQQWYLWMKHQEALVKVAVAQLRIEWDLPEMTPEELKDLRIGQAYMAGVPLDQLADEIADTVF